MSDVVSAGTFVAAVLETAGYLAQSEILTNFSDFFERFGYILFVIACIGALTSIALYGSYRFARLLILGPAMFYLMVGTFSNTQGAVWVAGGGIRSMDGSPANSALGVQSIRTAIAAKIDDPNQAAASMRPDIPVALPFKVYTKVVDSLMRTISDVILNSAIPGSSFDPKNPGGLNEDLLFLSRTKALDALLSTKMTDPELMKMFQVDFLTQCSALFEEATALSLPYLSVQRENELLQNALNTSVASYQNEFTLAADRIRKTRAHYTAGYAFAHGQANKERRVNAREATRQFMMAHETSNPPGLTPEQQLCHPGAHQTVSSIMAANYPGQSVSGVPDLTLTCDQMWSLVRDNIRCNAANIQQRLQLDYSGSNSPNALSDNLCLAIAKKLNRPAVAGAKCDLVEATAVAMFRNSILSSERSVFMAHVEAGMEFVDTVPEGHYDAMVPGEEDRYVIGENPQVYVVSAPDANGVMKPTGRVEVDAFDTKTQRTVRIPASKMVGMIAGTRDAGFLGHQEYTTHGLRQKVYTAAVQFPYWQGVLLYFIAIAYPFFCVLLVVPGRAGSFIYLPLAWLWVKSWEVGLAVAIVFDRVLWNSMPTMDFEKVFNNTTLKMLDQQLPTVISEAFKVDPSFNIHIYYYMMAMVLFAIPTVTGWIVMKAKSNVFSAIMGKATQMASEGEERASGEFGMLMINHNMLKMAEVRGAALWELGRRGEGLTADGRGDVASRFATIAASANAASRMASGWRSLTGISGAPAAIAAMPMDYANTYGSVLKADMGVAQAVNASYNTRFGRAGRYQMQLEAWMNAYDGGGGFEINFEDDMKAVVPAKLDATLLKVGIVSDAIGNLAGSGAVGATSVPWLGKVVQVEAMRQMIQNIFNSNEGAESGFQKNAREIEAFLRSADGRKEIEKQFDRAEKTWGELWGLSPDQVARDFNLPTQDQRQKGEIPVPTPAPDIALRNQRNVGGRSSVVPKSQVASPATQPEEP